MNAPVAAAYSGINPPAPASLSHLRASNGAGAFVVTSCAALTIGALAISGSTNLAVWLLGQVLLAIALVQWFAVLHECGHETLFRTRRLHALVGQIAGVLTLLPFYNWKRVHGRHHKWTGWQDLDPTTEALVPRPLGSAERLIVNICWRCWIPLFALLYRVNNFWHLPRLMRLFPAPHDRRALVFNSAVVAMTYIVVAIAIGPLLLLKLLGVATLLSFFVEDLLLLSQHTHVPQQISRGNDVRPFPTIEQEVFTRSLRFPHWASVMLLHIDAHELHHMYPFVPGYRLSGIAYDTENEIDWLTWLRGAKRLTGEVFLFQNRFESGADI